jgi:hypothetical protein
MVGATAATSPGGDSLDRGTFHDDYRSYRVRASSAVAPDSFQVITGPRNDDVVLIVSGLNSGDLKATWGPFWNRLKPQAKIWVEEQAFRIFYRRGLASASAIRFCDG